MADTSGQADIRGLYIDKKSKDYFNEASIFKKEVSVLPTPSREIRYYQKTSGFLTVASPGAIGGVAEGARPFVAEKSWTRNTANVKKYFIESPLITMEDETDTDVKVFKDNLRELIDAVAYDVDGDIWNVASEDQSPSNINSVTATAAWDAASGQDPFEDIMEGKQLIREQTKKKLTNVKIYVSAKGEKDLLVWMSGNSNIPAHADKSVTNGSLVSFAGLPVVVSENVTPDYAMVGDLSKAVEFRQFMPLKTYIIKEEGIGRKIRVSEHGIALLVKPKYLSLISNTEA